MKEISKALCSPHLDPGCSKSSLEASPMCQTLIPLIISIPIARTVSLKAREKTQARIKSQREPALHSVTRGINHGKVGLWEHCQLLCSEYPAPSPPQVAQLTGLPKFRMFSCAVLVGYRSVLGGLTFSSCMAPVCHQVSFSVHAVMRGSREVCTKISSAQTYLSAF